MHAENTNLDEKYGILFMYGHEDGIGIAATATGFLSTRGANIVEENAQVLGIDFFCVTLVFVATISQMERIRADCEIDLVDFHGRIIPAEKPEDSKRKIRLWYELDVIAEDEPCIAANIEGVMVRRGINIKEVRGKTVLQRDTGAAIYYGSFKLECGNSRCVRELQKDLKNLENEKGWELILRKEGIPLVFQDEAFAIAHVLSHRQLKDAKGRSPMNERLARLFGDD